jgi:DNA polymerase
MVSGVPPRALALHQLEEAARVCVRCPLWRCRKRAVPGEGPLDAPLFLVGEAPGRIEDVTGRPFVGRSGQLLEEALRILGIRREEVYITSSVKCRPPLGGKPKRPEIATCRDLYLYHQIEVVNPRVLVALGNYGLQALMGWEATVGKWRSRKAAFRGIPLVATYHPAAVLRNPAFRRRFRGDLRRAAKMAGEGGR